MAVIDDIKEGKGYILGVISFATAFSAFLTQVLHFRTEPTLVAVGGAAVVVLFVGWLVQKSEERQRKVLGEFQAKTTDVMNCCKNSLEDLKTMAVETQRSTLRIELNDAIQRSPSNHDTILKMAERYFTPMEDGGLGGDWYMSAVFCDWAEEENVHLPQNLRNVKRDN